VCVLVFFRGRQSHTVISICFESSTNSVLVLFMLLVAFLVFLVSCMLLIFSMSAPCAPWAPCMFLVLPVRRSLCSLLVVCSLYSPCLLHALHVLLVCSLYVPCAPCHRDPLQRNLSAAQHVHSVLLTVRLTQLCILPFRVFFLEGLKESTEPGRGRDELVGALDRDQTPGSLTYLTGRRGVHQALVRDGRDAGPRAPGNCVRGVPLGSLRRSTAACVTSPLPRVPSSCEPLRAPDES
jgi:hypothetical protein